MTIIDIHIIGNVFLLISVGVLSAAMVQDNSTDVKAIERSKNADTRPDIPEQLETSNRMSQAKFEKDECATKLDLRLTRQKVFPNDASRERRLSEGI